MTNRRVMMIIIAPNSPVRLTLLLAKLSCPLDYGLSTMETFYSTEHMFILQIIRI